jgi:hypothetical protein
MILKWKYLSTLALAGMTAWAQQQTGAPAGIAVPAPPPTRQPAPSSDPAPDARVFRVHLVDGRTGAPIAGGHVKLWYDEPSGTGYEMATSSRGIGLMPAPVGEPLRVLVGILDYNDCRRPARYSPPQAYNMAEIAKAGVATENTCGRVAVRPQPGELLFFVRPSRWYENLNRNAQ